MNRLWTTIPAALFLLFIFSTVSCSAGGGYKNITPQQAKEMLDSGDKDILLLDVRTNDEYRAGHLKGSRLIPIQVLSGMVDEISGHRDKKVIVYCAVGGRSSKASDLLISKGFKHIYNMEGGIKEWGRLGYEIVR